MKVALLEWLACPACGGGLTLDTANREDEEITEGRLACTACRAAYPVVRGIPRFLESALFSKEERSTLETFGKQWAHYSWLSAEYERQFLDWIRPVEPSFFRGKAVLDGGCGKGRHLLYASRYGARVIVGLDASDAVEIAYANLRGQDHVHIVQGDLKKPPLRPAFDYVYSIGVLHHMPEPKEGFKALARLLKTGGQITAWVYGRENNGWVIFLVKWSRRTFGLLPKRLAYAAIVPVSAAVFLFVKGLYGPLHRLAPRAAARLPYAAYFSYISKFSFREIHLIVADHLLPAIAHYIPREEFTRWFEDMSLAQVRIEWHNENSWRGHGVRRVAA